MRYKSTFAPEARESFRSLPAYHRATVREAIDLHLTHAPVAVSKSRIKRLQGLVKPQYRLRVGDLRVFYDVIGTEVQVLGIVEKACVEDRLNERGIRT